MRARVRLAPIVLWRFVLALILLTVPAGAQAQSFLSIFTKLPGDFARLVKPYEAITLAGGGALAGAVHAKDQDWADQARSDDAFFKAGGPIGDGATQAAAGLVVFVAGHLAHSDSVATFGTELLRAQIVSGVIADGIKASVTRTRPDGGHRSFPSGHASSAFATAAVIQGRYGWKAGVPAYALATYVAAARVVTYHHYPSDVLFGAAIGAASGHAVAFDAHKARVTVTPSAGLRSARVDVTISGR